MENKMTAAEAEEKVLELLGTHPAYIKDEDVARIVPYVTDSGLARIVPELTDSGLARIVPELTDSRLARIVPELTDSRLARIDALKAGVPVLLKPYTAILASITSQGCKLDMSTWHRCGTTHCLGGWTVHLAGEAGYALEKTLNEGGDGTPNAAALILRRARPDAPLPNFYAKDAEALAFIKARAREEAVPAGGK